MKTTTSSETIRCLKNYFNAYSRPRILISDRNISFTSKEFEEFMKETNVKHIRKVATVSGEWTSRALQSSVSTGIREIIRR